MSFQRHRKSIFRYGPECNTVERRTPYHRVDEFPTGYSLAGCAPALPASASPVGNHCALQSSSRSRNFQRTANSVLTVCVMAGGHPNRHECCVARISLRVIGDRKRSFLFPQGQLLEQETELRVQLTQNLQTGKALRQRLEAVHFTGCPNIRSGNRRDVSHVGPTSRKVSPVDKLFFRKSHRKISYDPVSIARKSSSSRKGR